MKKRYLLMLCFITLSLIRCFAQGADSLVLFKELTYYSNFEKETFTRFAHKDVDHFNLLLATGNLLTDDKLKSSRENFYAYVAGFEGGPVKKSDKRIKAIYDDLHKKYLSKYELKNRFEEIFYNGYYNCVSATALYALTFDRLKIPYSIMEEPDHVYLVAYPQAERIILQTTSPQGAYYSVSDEFKQNYGKRLKDQKLISAQEYASQDVRILFDKYYFGQDKEVDLQQLAGIQYLNDGLYKIDDKKPEEAFIQLEKAYLLYPSERISQLLFLAGAQSLEAHKAKDSVHAVLLGKLSRYKAVGLEPEMIVGEFARSTQSLLSESGDTEAYDKYYRVLDRSISNKELKDKIDFLYQYESGRTLYNKARYKEALPYLEKTMVRKPNNLDAQGLFLACLGQVLQGKSSNQEIIRLLEECQTKFAALQTNNNFNAMLANTYLIEFNKNYVIDKISEGDKFKTLFESLITKYPEVNVNSHLIGQSYSNAAVYFFRKGQVTKAKQIIASGLKFAPDNYELVSRQRMIK